MLLKSIVFQSVIAGTAYAHGGAVTIARRFKK